MSASILLQADDLEKHYTLGRKTLFGKPDVLKAVDGVSFYLREGETLGLVGESGSGKSTTGRLILRLLDPTAGQVTYRGQEILGMPLRQFKPYRKDMQMIFQDATSSLNPAYNIGQLLEEPMLVNAAPADGAARREKVAELLQQVGLKAEHATRYPHEFSGGQRQRIGIARALAVHPKLIVADEPVSALDVSVQSQILNLMQDMKQRYGLSYLFIAHDLAVVKHMSDRIAVMYLGKIVETASAADLYQRPGHPYTQMLLAAIPRMGADAADARRQRAAASAASATAAIDLPSPVNPRDACAFSARCPHRMPVCDQQTPLPRAIAPQHIVACHLL